MNNLQAIASTHNYSIIALTETWFDCDTKYDDIKLAGYDKPLRTDRPTHAGGVALYIKNYLLVKEQENLRFKINNTEVLWVKVRLQRGAIFFCVSYCAPTVSEYAESSDLFISYLDTCFEYTSAQQALGTILVGDFNAKVRSWGFSDHDNALGSRLHLFLEQNALSQLIQEPTRNGSLLDLIITDSPRLFVDSGTSPKLTSLCEHNIIWGKLFLPVSHNQRYYKEVLNVKNVNWDALNDALVDISWDDFYNNENPKPVRKIGYTPSKLQLNGSSQSGKF
jgi:hypothetical protein